MDCGSGPFFRLFAVCDTVPSRRRQITLPLVLQIPNKTTKMVSTPRPPIQVLRGILRNLRPPPHAKVTRPPVTREYILSRYRASDASNTSLDQLHRLRILSEEYYNLQKAIAERAELHKLDQGAEDQLSPKELSRRAAARAGLQLPQLNPEID